MPEKRLAVTCPLCGIKNEVPLEDLKEGALFQCLRCRVKLNLHGHMWEEIQAEIAKAREQ